MSKKFIITEDEKKYIKSLYGLLLENNGDDKIEVDFSNFYGDGKYIIPKDVSDKFEKRLNEKLVPFLTENPGVPLKITVMGGESATPNYDNEDFSGSKPDYFLAEKRREKMVEWLKNYFSTSKIEPKPIVDESPNEKNVNVFRKGVTQNDRFVKVYIEAIGKCLIGLKIDVIYTEIDGKKGDPIDSTFPCRGLRELDGTTTTLTPGRHHRCNKAEFNVLLNNVVIGTVNLNNAGKGDANGSISGSVEVTKEKALEIAKQNIDSIMLSLQCTTKDCHSDIPEIKITNKNGIIYHSCTPVTSRDNLGVINLLKLNKCGTEVLSQSGRGGTIPPPQPPVDFSIFIEELIKKQDATIAKAEAEAKTNPSVKIPPRTFVKLQDGNYKINCTHNQKLKLQSFEYKCGQTIDKNGKVL